jgi:hypothetical protein
MTGSTVWATEIGCKNSVFHTKTNASSAVKCYCFRKRARSRREYENSVYCNLDSLSSFRSNTVYLWHMFFYFSVDIASLLSIEYNIVHLLRFFNSQDILKERHLSLLSGLYPWQKRHLYQHVRESRLKEPFFFFALYLGGFHSCRYFACSLIK